MEEAIDSIEWVVTLALWAFCENITKSEGITGEEGGMEEEEGC